MLTAFPPFTYIVSACFILHRCHRFWVLSPHHTCTNTISRLAPSKWQQRRAFLVAKSWFCCCWWLQNCLVLPCAHTSDVIKLCWLFRTRGSIRNTWLWTIQIRHFVANSESVGPHVRISIMVEVATSGFNIDSTVNFYCCLRSTGSVVSGGGWSEMTDHWAGQAARWSSFAHLQTVHIQTPRSAR